MAKSIARCVLILSTIFASASVNPAAAQPKADEVTFALNWLPVGEAAGWYVALDKGYFRENNIDVNIVRGFGSGDTAKRVAAKRATFGVADIGTVILLRSNEGIKVTAVGMFFGRAPHAVFFRESSNIKTPTDLAGKSIACPATSANKVMFPAFASLVGLDASKVEWKITDPAVAIPTFAAGRADLVCEFLTSRPNIAAQSREKISQFVYADYGFRIYANAVIAQEDTIKQNPELVRRFVRAAMRGLDYAIKNPDEAVQTLIKYAPENRPVIAAEEWQVATDLIMTEEAKRNGVGYMDPQRIAATYDIITSTFSLDKTKDRIEDLYSNNFLK
jgi:NitT/TauT family transport system substrate-binding protein